MTGNTPGGGPLQPRYVAVFRSCDSVPSLHGNPRPFGSSDKQQVARVCFTSLAAALKTVPHEVHVLGDRISDSLRDFYAAHGANLHLGAWGNDGSIRESIALACRQDDNDWVFFCEDDYLHRPDLFTVADELIRNRDEYLTYKVRPPHMILLLQSFRTMPLVICPADDPMRYRPSKRFMSFLFLSRYCHWRQVSNTTFTFLMQAKTVKKYRSALLASSHGAKDKRLSRRLYARLWFRGKALCLAPIPGLSTHLHEGVMSPFVDWRSIWEGLRPAALEAPSVNASSRA